MGIRSFFGVELLIDKMIGRILLRILGAVQLAPNDLFIRCRREMNHNSPGNVIDCYTATKKDIFIEMNCCQAGVELP